MAKTGRLANADERTCEIARLDWNSGFWRIPQKGQDDDVGDWNNDQSGHVPPGFPWPVRERYQWRLWVGTAAYRGRLVDRKRGIQRQERETVMLFVRD